MNKNLFLGLFATFAMVLATSCSNDEVIEQGAGDMANVSFSINADAVSASRAISDGMTAKNLYYGVYLSNGDLVKTDVVTLENGRATLPLVLAKGQTYNLGFWAQAEGAPYTVSVDGGGMSVAINNEGVNNAENRDAFTANITYTVVGNAAKTVTLTRPFAQINVGVTNAEFEAAKAAGINVKISKVELNGSFGTGFDVLEGAVTSTVEGLNYEFDAIPADAEVLKVSGKDYKYISTSYVLPADASQTVDAKFTFHPEAGADIVLEQGLNSLPIKSNWRTNIIGRILTNNADFTVVIDPAYEGDINSGWDGQTTEEPQVVDGAYQVENAAQWAWISNKGILDKNLKLVNDIDFGGQDIAPIYPSVANCVIDGNGKTISNAVYKFANGISHYSIGLISMETTAINTTLSIKNLTLNNVIADNHDTTNDYGYAGALISDVQNCSTVSIDGVTVQNSKIKGIQSVGTIVGLIAEGSTVNINNTVVENNKLSNYKVEDESGYVCGLVGKVVGTLNVASDVRVENNEINAIFAIKRGPQSIDAVAAVRENGVINNECTPGNNTIKKTPIVEADLMISTKAELLDFAANYSKYNFKTVALVNDIDLEGVDWNPIGGCGEGIDDPSYVTFEGCGYTIKNLNVVEKAGTTEHEAIGFFGWLAGSVKNLNFENANVEGGHYVGVVAGYFQGYQDSAMDNCNVNGATVKCVNKGVDGRDGDKCGVLAGYSQAVVKNCKISNSTVEAGRDAGQGVGACTNPSILAAFTGNTVDNVTVSNNGTGTGANIKNEFVGRTN